MSKQDNAESFKTASGLPDDYDGVITDATFTTDANIQDGEVLILRLTVQPDEESGYEEQVKDLTLGKGWETVDGGKTARAENGKDLKIISNSKYGKLLDRVALDEKDGGLGLGEMMAERGSAKKAETWVGLKFHWINEKDTFTTKEGTEKTYYTFLPTEFIGDESSSSNGSTADEDKPKKAAPATGNKALKAKLTVLAKKAESSDDFQEKALEVDGVAEDDDLLDAVVSGRLYEEVTA